MKIRHKILIGLVGLSLLPRLALSEDNYLQNQSLTKQAIIEALGWKQTGENRCGGYYLEPAIASAENKENPEAIQMISSQFKYSFKGTSESQGKVTIRRYGQEITANKAYLYRDPITGKLNSGSIDLIGHVMLREPNTLVVAERGRFNFQTKSPSLVGVIYRTSVYSNSLSKKNTPAEPAQLENAHKNYQLSAWGKADTFDQPHTKFYILDNASYTTCPPTQSIWKVQAQRINLDKENGRGEAYHAKVLLHNVPIFYAPYINFPLDSRRKTGFLWPKFGSSSKFGAYVNTPFYWNMAPNYDMTITPTLMYRRALLITDRFRYLTPLSEGYIQAAVLPYDPAFVRQKSDDQEKYGPNSPFATDPFVQAELNRLLNDSNGRASFIWRDQTYFNENWSSKVDYNYVSDDYYLSDLNSNINEVTQNQLLQQADLTFKGNIWNFTGRLQGYQTLHPINADHLANQNQYSRFPQLIFNGNYPDEKYGVDYGINNELTRFDFRNTPGDFRKFPMGDRLNVQPMISYPYTMPYLFAVPRLQYAMTKYEIGHVDNNEPKAPGRMLPIFDVSAGLNFDRDLRLFNRSFLQTLEPQIYYTYIPYKNQNQLPVFDTTVNQLTYDQLFTYNRFSGIDRINDANQVAVGLTTRFIDKQSGLEKIRAAVGQIIYFRNRKVVLCDDPLTCNPSIAVDNPANPENRRNRSPISGLLKYTVNPAWSLEANTIWDPLAKYKKLMNQTATLHYQPDLKRIVNLGYTFVRNGDRRYPDTIDKSANNLSQTDLSAAWPLTSDWSGVTRWTQNLNRHGFQNLLFGVQYDACCWAVRIVTGKQFTGVDPQNNRLLYDNLFFIQFALKGLGSFGTADPTQLLVNSVSGYSSQFGQDY